jgi:UDP-glucose 4-epimerase
MSQGRILVTGGAGFIGSNLVDHLLAQGRPVRVLDNFSTGKRENLAHCQDQIELIEGDLADLDTVQRAVEGVEAILHHAAIASVPRSVSDPLGSNEANVLGTLHVLLAARDTGVQRVIYASSSSIYGDLDEDQAKVESMKPQPISPYGVAKLAAEYYCQVFYHNYGLETVGLRYFNVFGPRQDPTSHYAAVVPRFIMAMLRGEPPTIYGDGGQTRDFTFVADVIRANMLALEAEEASGQAFNVARHHAHSVNELVEVLNELLQTNIQPEHTEPRPGDIRHSLADIGEAKVKLGYTPQISFAEGLSRTVEWFRDNGQPSDT